MEIIVSAPGKLMLMGEHAVVYGYPSIVTAIDQRLKLRARVLEKKVFELYAPDVEIINYSKSILAVGKCEVPKGAKFVELALVNFLNKYPVKEGVRIETVSAFKAMFGFGSSSAIVACTIKALCVLFGVKLSNKELFNLAYQTVLDVQGVGSGFDIAAAIYGGTLYYVYPGKIIRPINTKALGIVVGYSGVKADTAIIVKRVAEESKSFPIVYKSIYAEIGQLIPLARKALVSGKVKEIGQLMNINQGYLESLGVGTSKLSQMIYACREAGAWGAKISGAGGGDCMFSVCSDKDRLNVEQAIKKAGGEVIKVGIGAEGVRLEND